MPDFLQPVGTCMTKSYIFAESGLLGRYTVSTNKRNRCFKRCSAFIFGVRQSSCFLQDQIIKLLDPEIDGTMILQNASNYLKVIME